MMVGIRFAWYDFWVGVFWDRHRGILYLCPIPMLVIDISFQYFWCWKFRANFAVWRSGRAWGITKAHPSWAWNNWMINENPCNWGLACALGEDWK